MTAAATISAATLKDMTASTETVNDVLANVGLLMGEVDAKLSSTESACNALNEARSGCATDKSNLEASEAALITRLGEVSDKASLLYSKLHSVSDGLNANCWTP